VVRWIRQPRRTRFPGTSSSAGNKLAGRCQGYQQNHGLPIDDQGKNGLYDLVVTCTDLFLPKHIRDNRIVLVQEGITDPESECVSSRQAPPVPSSLAGGISTTGLSDAYRARSSEPETARRLGSPPLSASRAKDIATSLSEKGVRPEKIVVTSFTRTRISSAPPEIGGRQHRECLPPASRRGAALASGAGGTRSRDTCCYPMRRGYGELMR
jgi:hypothetical protein